MDLPSIPVGPVKVRPGTRSVNVAVPCSHMRMGTITGAVAPGSTKGGPALNPFGDVQIGVVWIARRYAPAEKPPTSATIVSPPSYGRNVMSPCPTPPAMGPSRAPIEPVDFAPREAGSSPDAHAASTSARDAASAPRAAPPNFDFAIRIFFVCRDREHHKR